MTSLCRSVTSVYEMLKTHRQHVKYLVVVPFLVALAVVSYRIGHSTRSQTDVELENTKPHRARRDVKLPTVDLKAMMPGGAVYIRWGRTMCANGSDTVYRGVAGGSWYDNHGGGSNYLCLPLEPIWGAYDESVEKHSKLYGSEYKNPLQVMGLNNNLKRPLHDQNVPCAVCRSQTKSSVVMVPARNQCYSGWQTEYTGYLVSEKSSHKGRTEFVCMDGEPESDPAGYRDENGALFYGVEGVCGSLPCPPYIPRRDLTCAVCTK